MLQWLTVIYKHSDLIYREKQSHSYDEKGNLISGQNSIYNSGFNGKLSDNNQFIDGYSWPAEKYFDKYLYSTENTNYQRRILGDATGEMGPFNTQTYLTQTRQIGSWYADYAYFIYSIYPWFYRGGNNVLGLEAGMFAFNSTHGCVYIDVSFRVVLML